jgi:hypothetical protein
VDAGPLGLTRIAVGLGGIAKLFVIAPDLLGLSLSGVVHLPWWPGFAPALAAPFVIIGAWAASAIAFTAGFRTRTAGVVLVIVASLTLISDRQLYSNHLYLLILLTALLVLADSGAARSVDAGWRSGRTVPALGPDLIRIQVTIVYFFAALWKLNLQFLSGWVLGTYLAGGFVSLPAFARTPEVLSWLALMSVLAEFFICVGLWSRRLRNLATVTGVVLHVAFVVFIAAWGDLVVFGLLTVGCYPLFHALRAQRPTLGPRAASGY